MNILDETVGAVGADATGNLLSDTTSILSNLTSLASIESTLRVLAVTVTCLAPDWPKSSEIISGTCFDFVIVGAGDASCVLARRLTEVAGWRAARRSGGDPPITSDVLYP
ncbi:hypothetical protein EVAR_90370_1 [Eumeta japonica]|uniref:Uncharacterized protein n=1 Tax=Eumeta variegata TaxID=151549 RepID=A0A4C1YCJ2_EUMVA|nr:hypothetical protein EVAR_90370_1 [Eumeta japonica]